RASSLVDSPLPSRVPTPSLHDALPISAARGRAANRGGGGGGQSAAAPARGARARGRSATRPDHVQPTAGAEAQAEARAAEARPRSEEHTSELQSRVDLVCRLLLEKKKK